MGSDSNAGACSSHRKAQITNTRTQNPAQLHSRRLESNMDRMLAQLSLFAVLLVSAQAADLSINTLIATRVKIQVRGG